MPRRFVRAFQRLDNNGEVSQRLGDKGDAAEGAVNRALHDPHRDGLWRYDPDSASVTVHVLVAAAAAALDPEAESRERTRQAALITLTEMFRECATDIGQHQALSGVGPHARHLISGTGRLEEVTANLLRWIARYDLEAGRAAASAEQYERLLSWQEEALGPDHPATLTSRSNLADDYRAAGRLAEALALFERTLADCERLLGPDHPDTLISRSNLATADRAAGRLAEALALFEHTLADAERILGTEHPDTLVIRNNVAVAHSEVAVSPVAGCNR